MKSIYRDKGANSEIVFEVADDFVNRLLIKTQDEIKAEEKAKLQKAIRGH